MLPKVNYLKTRDLLRDQRDVNTPMSLHLPPLSDFTVSLQKAIIAKIRQHSRSHVVHKGLMQFKDAPPGFKMEAKDIPGLRERSPCLVVEFHYVADVVHEQKGILAGPLKWTKCEPIVV